jgi:hypothetical protein
MAGTIIADFIRTDANKLSLNVGNTTFATINSMGILSNTGSVIINASGQVPNTVITGTMTQAQIGTNVAATGPVFFAHRSSSQSISSSTYTRINFQTEVFDIGSCYDNATNYRFTPNVAGYYWLGSTIGLAAPNNRYTAYLYRNGSLYMSGPDMIGNGVNSQGCVFSGIVYANGTTDFFEIYVQGNNSATVEGSAYYTYFQGYLVRAA